MNLNEIKFVSTASPSEKKAALTKGRKKIQKNGRRNTSGFDANSGDFDERERRLRAAYLPL
jgi:hypothetical protein